MLQRSALEFFLFISRDVLYRFRVLRRKEEHLQMFDSNETEKLRSSLPRSFKPGGFDAEERHHFAIGFDANYSNFDYILALNTLAGRSYLDITQYPVFPHVIADYESDVLDLNDPKTFRDLSKPIGALNPKRLNQVKERYDALKDDPEIPPFHYGSHYSSAGVVMFYLLRLEPFTTLAYNLQGGKFDHADRLFTGVESMWKSVLNDISDVKELTPEFFTMPEMFLNLNNCDFGTTQKGEKVGDVKLPKWASNAVDFVAKQRAALEI